MENDLNLPIPHGWHGGESVTKWWRGKYVHLYRLGKACAQCGLEMKLDVTKAALLGTAKNSGLHLTRCAECRQKNPRDVTSRPTTRSGTVRAEDPPYEPPADDNGPTEEMVLKESTELTALRLQNEAFLRSVLALQRENEMLKARLAKHEPPKTYTLPKPPLTMAESTERLLAAVAVINGKPKVPWE
jgi:hypothetical protein